MSDTVNKVETQWVSTGADKVASDLNKVAAAEQALQTAQASGVAVQDRAAKSTLSLANAVERYIRQQDPLGRAMSQLERGERLLDGARKQGLDTVGRLEQSLSSLKSRYDWLTSAAQANAHALEAANAKAQKAAEIQAQVQRAAAMQTGIAGRLGIGREVYDARGSASAFEAEFKRRDAVDTATVERGIRAYQELAAARLRDVEAIRAHIDALRSAEAGSAFNSDLNARLGIGQSAISKGATTDAFREQFAEQDRMAARAKALTQSHLPETAELERNRSIRKEIVDIERAGLVTRKSALDMLGAERIRHEQSLESIKGMRIAQDKYAAGVGLARHELINLSRQVQDVGVSLAGGQNPMTVLIQQGSQIGDIFASSRASMKDTLIAGASWAGRFALSTAGIATAALAAGAAVAYLGASYRSTMKEIDIGLMGRGRGSGLTAQGVDSIGRSAAGAMSVSESRGVAAGLAGTGTIDKALLPGLTKAAYPLSILMGGNVEDAGKALAEAFADPTRGADKLNERLGFLSGGLRDYIRSAQASGDKTAAQKALFDAMLPTLTGAEQKVGVLRRAWEGLSNAASNAADAVGRAAGGPANIDEALAKFTQRRDEAAKVNQNAGLFSITRSTNQKTIDEANREIARLEKQIAERNKKVQDDEREAKALDLSRQAADVMRQVSPDEYARQGLRDNLSVLNKTAMNPGAAEKVEGIASLADAYGRAKQAHESFLTSDERQRQSDMLTIRSIEARTVAQKASVAADRERIALAGQHVGSEEVARRAKAAADAVYAQDRVESRDKLRDSRNAASLVGMTDYQRRLAESRQRWAKEIEASQGDPQSLAMKRQAAALDASAIQRESVIGPMKQARHGLDDQIAALERQKQAFGASAGAAAEFAARQQLLNEYQRAGIPITADLMAKVNAYAAGMGKVTQAGDELQRAQSRVVGGMDDIRGEARSAFSGMLAAMREGKSGAQALLDGMTRITDKMLERLVAQPLVEGLLGQDGKAGGGLFGDGLARMFGGGGALSTANITAATVIVNGQGISSAIQGWERQGLPLPKPANDAGGVSPSFAPIGAARSSIPTFAGVAGSDVTGAGLLRRFEGFRSTPYWDVNAYRTGYGSDTITLADGTVKRVSLGMSVSRADADRDLSRRLQNEFVPKVASQTGASWDGLPQSAKDALTSVGYNYGSLPRNVAAAARSGDVSAIAAAIRARAGDNDGINSARRNAEADYMLRPDMGGRFVTAPKEIDGLADAAKRASDATNGLGSDFGLVSKSLSTGGTSLASAGQQIGQSASAFTTAGDGVFSTILGGIGQVGNSFVGGLGTVLQTVLQGISQSGGGGAGGFLSSLIGGAGGLFSGSTGTGGTYANGGVFLGGNVVPFATGGVTAGPTYFPMSGGRTGLMGEAGPEAIMPLSRGPDGRLGVRAQAHGPLGGAPLRPGYDAPVAALSNSIQRLGDRIGSGAANDAGGPLVVVENHTPAKVTTQEERTSNGGRRVRARIDEAMADAAGRPNSQTMRAMAAANAVGRR